MTTPLVAGLPPLLTVAVKFTLEPYVELFDDALRVVVVISGEIVTMTAIEAEAARFDVPPKVAVIVSLPAGNVDKLSVATPTPFTIPVPTEDPLLKKVTTPLVAGTPLTPTEAVRVTLEPNNGVVVDELKVVVVLSGETVTVTALEAEGARFDVPPKVAVIVLLPVGNVDKLSVATPAPFTTPVPTEDPLLKKVTTPLVAGTPPTPTEAVKVTLVPNDGVIVEVLRVVAVLSGETVTVTALEAEGARFDVPPKVAVIVLLPVGNVDKLSVATPAPFTDPVPTEDPLLRKVTTPLFAETPLTLIVAVRDCGKIKFTIRLLIGRCVGAANSSTPGSACAV